MNVLLICPAARRGTELLRQSMPLAALSMCGQSLLEYWLSDLAGSGIQDILVLAQDRPHELEQIASGGSRWGTRARVIPVERELTPAEALTRHGLGENLSGVVILDHFPGLGHMPLYNSYRAWFAGLEAWLPYAASADRVGIREVSPGVWVHVQARVSADAELHAPCWVGRHVRIASGAVIGPSAVVEDGSVIDRDTEVSQAYIGPQTIVGRFTSLRCSIAIGNLLVDWATSSAVEVVDPFLLSALRKPKQRKGLGWFSRISSHWWRSQENAPVQQPKAVNQEFAHGID